MGGVHPTTGTLRVMARTVEHEHRPAIKLTRSESIHALIHTPLIVRHRRSEHLTTAVHTRCAPTPPLCSRLRVLLEHNLPKPHIKNLHLRIHQVVSLEASPRFLEAVLVCLVKVHEPEDGLQAVFPRRHLVCRNAILKESVVRGHAPGRSHEDFRDEDRGHRARDHTGSGLIADRPKIVGDVVVQLLSIT